MKSRWEWVIFSGCVLALSAALAFLGCAAFKVAVETLR